MKELDLQSKYAKPSYKPMTTRPNEDSIKNVLKREFEVDKEMSVLISDFNVREGSTPLELRLFPH